ncbi:hypothetical protein BY996DRAFT_1462155 [Phakopsora pachyrhizi]|nr:hypothetical protein BY996DRAFT_1462155 [Phakopsora pachyrhizi]
MARGFVVLQIPEEIYIKQLSVKLSGNSQANGLTSSTSASSSSMAVLVDDEYTILDAATDLVSTSPELPSYDLYESSKTSTSSIDLSLTTSRFPLPLRQDSQMTQGVVEDEISMIDHNLPERTGLAVPLNSQKIDFGSSDSQIIPPFGVAKEDPLYNFEPDQLELLNPESSPNLRSASSTFSHSQLTLCKPEEVMDFIPGSGKNHSTSRTPLRPPRMYQDSVFSNMLTDRYSVLLSAQEKSKKSVASSIDETHSFLDNLGDLEFEDSNKMTDDDSEHCNDYDASKISTSHVGGINRRRSLTSIASGVSNIWDNFRTKKGLIFNPSPKVTRIDGSSMNDLYRGDGFEANFSLAEPIQPRLNKKTKTKVSAKNLRSKGSKKSIENQRGDEGGVGNMRSKNLDSLKSGSALGNSGWRGPMNETKKVVKLIREGSLKLKQTCRRKSTSEPIRPVIDCDKSDKTFKNDGDELYSAPCFEAFNGLTSQDRVDALKLKPGVYKYPIVIPVSGDLPPSVKCQSGSISYFLDATLTYQTLSSPKLLNLKHQTSVELVDPSAGVPSLSPTNLAQSPDDEDLVNAVCSSYSGMTIERMWDDQLFYQIRLNSRKFLIGGRISFDIQFTPLAQMKIYSFQADVEEKTQYYLDHEKHNMKHCDSQTFKLISLGHTSPITIATATNSPHTVKLRPNDIPILPIISSDLSFVKKSPLIPHVKRGNIHTQDDQPNAAGETDERMAIETLTKYSKEGGPWNLGFDLSCNHKKSSIVIKHYLKLRMRVERGDDKALDNRGRRKRYDIILSSPIQIISCRCKPYSLPAYSSSDMTNVTDVLSFFKEINNSKEFSLRCNCVEKFE